MNKIFYGDVLNFYNQFDTPTVIISDGPYGVSGYKGDLKTEKGLQNFYKPHIEKWSEKSTAQTTLWFWCTEVGWAVVHPLLEENGWVYRGLNIWDKGVKHIAGNCNGKTMRMFPTVTEVCAHYVRKPEFKKENGKTVDLQTWLREEWLRTNLPLNDANKACGVKNAATRKYLTKDHLWYFPPEDVFAKMKEYANKYGAKTNEPYFDYEGDFKTKSWEKLRGKFNFEYGASNVWYCPAVRGEERIKIKNKALHPNQKPLFLMDRIIKASSDEGDLVWEPFAGLATASFAAKQLNRSYVACEINKETFNIAKIRLS